jgi:hypothetical protein
LYFAPGQCHGLWSACKGRQTSSRLSKTLGVMFISLILLQLCPVQGGLQPSCGTMLGDSRLPRMRRSAGHQGEGYLSNMGTLPTKHLDVLRRASEDGNICGRDPFRTATKTSHDFSAAENRPFLGHKDERPPLALCLDFDKTISQDHLYHLTRRSRNGLAGD